MLEVDLVRPDEPVTTRILDRNDAPALQDLLQSRKSVFDTESTNERMMNLINSSVNGLDDRDSRDIWIGSFASNSELKASIRLRRWNRMPYATVSHLVIRTEQSHKFLITRSTGFGNLYEFALNYGWSIGITKFYCICSAKHFAAWQKLRAKKGAANKRFTRMVEEFIPANTDPQCFTWRDIMGADTLPVDTIIFSEFLTDRLSF